MMKNKYTLLLECKLSTYLITISESYVILNYMMKG